MGNITVNWNGHTSQVAINKAGQSLQTFDSEFAWNVFEGPHRFTGVQFHFHAGSEHTVNGKRHDLEIHTVHLPEQARGGIKYAAVGVFFSEKDFDAELSPLEE